MSTHTESTLAQLVLLVDSQIEAEMACKISAAIDGRSIGTFASRIIKIGNGAIIAIPHGTIISNAIINIINDPDADRDIILRITADGIIGIDIDISIIDIATGNRIAARLISGAELNLGDHALRAPLAGRKIG